VDRADVKDQVGRVREDRVDPPGAETGRGFHDLRRVPDLDFTEVRGGDLREESQGSNDAHLGRGADRHNCG